MLNESVHRRRIRSRLICISGTSRAAPRATKFIPGPRPSVHSARGRRAGECRPRGSKKGKTNAFLTCRRAHPRPPKGDIHTHAWPAGGGPGVMDKLMMARQSPGQVDIRLRQRDIYGGRAVMGFFAPLPMMSARSPPSAFASSFLSPGPRRRGISLPRRYRRACK